jgi:PAS domain S-box-containing protein
MSSRFSASGDMRQHFLEAILESAIDYAIIAIDLDGLVTSWNEGARLILGWTEAEMLGKPAATFFTEEDRRAGILDAEMQSALAKGRGNDERWHLTKDHTRFWASGEMMVLRDNEGVVQGFIKVLRDRTRLRNDQEKQRADAEFMRKVLAASEDCIKVLDLDANLTFMSEGGMRVMEVDDFNAIAGCPWPDFWQLEGNVAAKAAVATAQAGGSARFTGFATTLKGSPRWWDVQVSPILGTDGKPERILSVSRDITATKTAEDLAAESQRRLRLTLTSGRLGYWHLDLASGEMECSDICKQNYGRRPDDNLTYQQVLEAIHPQDRERLQQAMAATTQNGQELDIQYRILKGGDDVVWLMVRAQIVQDDHGTPVAMSGISLDITAIKQVEERLARSEERLNLALSASGMVGIWDWDLRTDLVYADPNFAEIYTVSPEKAAAGAPLADYIRNFHPEDMPEFQAELDRLFAGQNGFSNEYRILQPDGDVRWVHARGRLIKDESDTPIRFSGASVEITERKRAEETQRLLMHELAHRVKNTLAVVQAITTQSLRNATSVEEAGEKLRSRINTLASAHDVLMQSNWVSASIRDVIDATAVNLGLENEDRLKISGPSVLLAPQAALSFSLVTHELLTNAVKYGALSNAVGQVEASWQISSVSGIATLSFRWKETGGPVVTVPQQTGFGSRLIKSSLGGFGKVEMVYDPDGLVLDFSAPLTSVETQPVAD